MWLRRVAYANYPQARVVNRKDHWTTTLAII